MTAAEYRARGAALKKEGRRDEALAAYRKAIAAEPGHAAAYMEVGGLLFDQGRLEQAIAYWRKAADLRPSASAFHNIGIGLRQLRRREEASAMFRQAIAAEPKRPDSYVALGGLHREAREHEEALGVYEDLRRALPGSPDAIAGIAAVHEAEGRVNEAYELVRPLVEEGASHAGLMAVYALVCHRLAEPPSGASARLEKALQRGDLPAAERRKITIGLANLCDALGRHDEAFAWFREVHRLDPGKPEIRKANLALPERQARAYTAERLAQLPRADHGSELPIFIVGMPRSGTSLAEQILSSHPKVYGAGELIEIGKLSSGNLKTGVPFPACLEVLTRDGVNQLARGYLERLRALAPSAERVTDKMPLNFLHLGLIEVLFPRARVVHCVRHPLDTCLSVYFNEFTEALSFTKDLATLGAYYREYWKLMQHWKRALRVPVFELRYEDMVADAEPMCRKLVDFCALEWNDACLRFYETKRKVATPSYHQVRQPIYSRSVARYKPYEAFLAPLRDSLADLIAEYESR